MNKDRLIKISNLIGLVSIVLLVYWVFIFISITVFGFKIFRENITESFYLSIIGILALMFGALMINIMFNLTKISDYISSRQKITGLKVKRGFQGIIFISSFPIVFGLLFGGDYLSTQKKKRVLIQATEYIVENYKNKIDNLFGYEYSEKFTKQANEIIDFLQKTDEHIQSINFIVRDTLGGDQIYMLMGNIYIGDKGLEKKIANVYKCSKEEKNYLDQVFLKESSEIRFEAHDGDYELYYPLSMGDKTIVLYYSEHQRYGKFGS